jgi:predicted amidohydrolase
MMGYDIFTACAMQADVYATRKRADIKRNLKRCLELIDVAPEASSTAKDSYKAETWAPVKLVSFNEFFLQGHDATWSFDHYMKQVVVEVPGEETEQLSRKAKEHNIYISGCVLEYDPEWKEHFFNTQFIISPKGEIIHKYRKITTAVHWELCVSPHDVLDKFTEKYGDTLEAFLPVTQTEIGKIGTITCMDGHFPETARALGVNGAEIIIRPNMAGSLMSPPMDIWQIENRLRAFENLCYLIAPSRGQLLEAHRPKCFVCGKAMIVNYNGVVLGYADYPGETIVTAVINLEELRRRRTDPSRNFVSQLRNEIYRKIYEKSFYPPNQFLDHSPRTRAARGSQQVLKKLFDEGIYEKPASSPKKR